MNLRIISVIIESISLIALAGCGSDADSTQPVGDASAQDLPADAVQHDSGKAVDAPADAPPDAVDAQPDAVDAGPGPFKLHVDFEGAQQFSGKILHFILVNDATGYQRPESAWLLHGGPTTWFETYKDLELGGTYALHYHIDVDDDHACDAGSNDIVGMTSIGPVFDDVVLAVDLTQAVSGDCSVLSSGDGPFDFYLFLEGFSAEESSHKVYLELSPGAFVETYAQDQMLFFSNTLHAGQPVEVRIFVDLDDDGQCDLPPTDHVWGAEVTAVDEDVWLDFALGPPYDATSCIWM